MSTVAAIIVKANAGWACAECGSTEYIQAHHEIPGDDSSMISLCAEHHSQRHPYVPKGLFFSHTSQPYWANKSAASLARELKVHPRTIIRIAKRLQVSTGILSPLDEELIKNNLQNHRSKSNMPRNNTITLRFDDEERKDLSDKATHEKLSVSAFLRLLIKSWGNGDGLKFTQKEQE